MRGLISTSVAFVVLGAFAVLGACSRSDSSDDPKAAAPTAPTPIKATGERATGTDPGEGEPSDRPSEANFDPKEQPPGKAVVDNELGVFDNSDYVVLARVLARAGACAGDASPPKVLPATYVADYCKKLRKSIESYRENWLDKARPFFDKLVPASVPSTVVYPFAGADLVSVLAVFPKAEDITTLSLEPAGDPRPINELSTRALQKSLTRARTYASRLLRISHNRTVDMSRVMTWGKLPGHIIFTLLGLSIHGYEPVSMRFFMIEKDGGIRYVGSRDVAALAAPPDGKQQTVSHKVLPHRLKPWANVEIRFRREGDDEGDIRVYRHIRANLHNRQLEQDDRVIKYLETKGRISAMTKAASYLLWKSSFSRIRGYLLANMEWMVSDATGVPPEVAIKAGFEQRTYGHWTRPIRDSRVKPERVAQIRKFWVKNRVGSVPFLFGYPGGPGGLHLMVTRPKSAP